ncbi:Slp family lipoprotein [Candidatus Methylocalor cossyra]|uniref:Starvation lipoprotein Slp paralog n=1 Tax=Candidatus Methylocalor cossyra TaxID=3108543 RepID=A0ABM9NKI3_9GAMM
MNTTATGPVSGKERWARLLPRLAGLLIPILMVGCASSPISKPLRQATEKQPSFAEINARPDAFKGRMVRLGGVIVQTLNKPKVSEVEVLQKPLQKYDDRPQDTDASLGRFLVRCPGFLDPAVYAKGREVTVAGEVEGRETRPLDQIQYTYPVIGCKQIYLWPQQPAVAYAYPPYYWSYPWWGGWPGYYPYWYPYWPYW